MTTDAPPPSSGRRVDVSMSLLVDMMTNTLDDGYRLAAERRTGAAPDQAGREPAAARSRRPVWLPLLVLLGLLTGTAAAQVRERAREGSVTRAELAGTVEERTAQTEALERQVEGLRAELAAARADALGTGAAGRRAAERLAALETAAGTVPVEGPGLVLVLDDPPAPREPEVDPRAETGPDVARVLDRDVQDAVNGLWAAGAEAVAVDGLRLTALTAIRSAGENVLVDYRPVLPPYEIEAVGDPEDLRAAFEASDARRRLDDLASRYGIGVELREEDALRLPGAGAPDLRAVELP